MGSLVQVTSLSHILLLYTGLFGALFSLITAIVLSLQTVRYFKAISREEQSDRPKYGFIILIVLFGSIILTSISHLSINTNLLSQLFTSSMTSFQCIFGYLLFYICGSITMTSLYIMLLHRIKVVFEGSVYQYESYIFRLYYCLIFIDSALFIGDKVFRGIFTVTFDVLYESKYGLSVCCANTKYDTINIHYSLIITSIMHIFLALSFLFMFIKRLYLLNQGMIERFMVEHCSQQSTTRSSTVGSVIEQYRSSIQIKQRAMSASVQRIIELNDLIKKQTILVIIIIIGTLIFWSLIAFNTYYIQLFGFDFTVNALCVWLMNGSSKKYWIFCTKYGFCRCCYTQNIDDVSINKCKENRKELQDKDSIKPYVRSPALNGINNIRSDSLHIVAPIDLNEFKLDTNCLRLQVTPAPSRRQSVLESAKATPIVDILEDNLCIEMGNSGDDLSDDFIMLEQILDQVINETKDNLQNNMDNCGDEDVEEVV